MVRWIGQNIGWFIILAMVILAEEIRYNELLKEYYRRPR